MSDSSQSADTPTTVMPARILCIDDDEFALSFYEAALSSAGYVVTMCQDPNDAFDMVANASYDLILLDIEMPQMSGLVVLDRLRKDDRMFNVPTLLASSDNSQATIEEGLSLGADDYLVKPMNHGELLAKVSTALRKRKLTTMAVSGLPYGSVLSGKYRVTNKLGTGGFSTVYSGVDLSMEPPLKIAIKIFLPERTADPKFMSQFLREAYAHSRMTHKNIVELMDFGQSNNAYYLVMEYLDGMNLEEIVTVAGVMSEHQVATVAFDVLSALRYLNENELIHRDIKTHNIIITGDEETKLLDFGLARTAGDRTLSSPSSMCGTPFFLSPEYIRGTDDLDRRTDIYSLGMTLYYILTRRSPFPRCSDMEMVHHHLNTAPMPLELRLPEVTPVLARLVNQMLLKDRDRRPDAAALLPYFEELKTTTLT